jgi:hypothetical protein
MIAISPCARVRADEIHGSSGARQRPTPPVIVRTIADWIEFWTVRRKFESLGTSAHKAAEKQAARAP